MDCSTLQQWRAPKAIRLPGFLGTEEGRHQTRSTVLRSNRRIASVHLPAAATFVTVMIFPSLFDIASQLNACTRVRGERRKALVLDLKDFVTAHEHVLRSALDTSECAFLGFLSHLAHRGVVLAAHIVTDPTRQRLRSGPD